MLTGVLRADSKRNKMAPLLLLLQVLSFSGALPQSLSLGRLAEFTQAGGDWPRNYAPPITTPPGPPVIQPHVGGWASLVAETLPKGVASPLIDIPSPPMQVSQGLSPPLLDKLAGLYSMLSRLRGKSPGQAEQQVHLHHRHQDLLKAALTGQGPVHGPMSVLSQVRVGADYAGNAGAGQVFNPDYSPHYTGQAVPHYDSHQQVHNYDSNHPRVLNQPQGVQQYHPNRPREYQHHTLHHSQGSQSAHPQETQNWHTHVHDPSKVPESELLPPPAAAVPQPPPESLKAFFNYHSFHIPQAQNKPGQSQTSPIPILIPLPAPVPANGNHLLMANLFSIGQEKVDNQKRLDAPGPVYSKRGLQPIPGLSAPLHHPPKDASAPDSRIPCDPVVDMIFAFDDAKKVWLARESIRFYVTQLMASPGTRFGVVMCGKQETFYTALHSDFPTLLGSLDDLEHANATLDPSQQTPDTPSIRSNTNPYPPSVSKDFAHTMAGCLETSYHLMTFDRRPGVNRLLAVVGTKERWGAPWLAGETRFLKSLNFSLLTLADARLSPHTQASLRKMASSSDSFRLVEDNITMRALPSMIGTAICKPHKADVTAAVERAAPGRVQEPVITGCRQVNATSLERTIDFGSFFGLQKEQITCGQGRTPNTGSCTCV